MLQIQHIPISSLKPRKNNARVHSDRQIAQIAKSIESFSFNTPILIDRNNVIIAGHGRVLACQKLGWQEVPTIQLEHLTEAQACAFAIADNRLTENSVWNDRLLAESFKELTALDLNFNIEATGFTMGEIDLKIENLSPAPEASGDPGDQLPNTLQGPIVSKSGDLWILGKHRLLCGTALESSAYETLMQGKLASLIFTDPPYNVPIHGHVSGNGKIQHREFAMASGEMSEQEFIAFLSQAFGLMAKNSHSGSIHYICMDWRHSFEIMTAGRATYADLKNICIWAKDNGGMGSLYRSQHEMVFVFKHGMAPHKNNVQLGQYGRYRTNVWNYPLIKSLSKAEEGNLLTLHPTVKPVQMVADAIMDCSARGDIVLDPFLGSGSTLLAAERVGRICYGIEIDPLYIDIAIRRWQHHSGDHAVHGISGKNFDDLAVQAGEGAS